MYILTIRNNKIISAKLRLGTSAALIIPSSVNAIRRGLFTNDKILQTIDFGLMSKVSGWCFWACSGLSVLSIPPTVRSIGYKAFGECRNISAIELSVGVKMIASHAFMHCIRLNEITIPNSVRDLGGSVFLGCKKLITASLLCDVKLLANKNIFKGCCNLKAIYCASESQAVQLEQMRDAAGIGSLVKIFALTAGNFSAMRMPLATGLFQQQHDACSAQDSSTHQPGR